MSNNRLKRGQTLSSLKTRTSIKMVTMGPLHMNLSVIRMLANRLLKFQRLGKQMTRSREDHCDTVLKPLLHRE